MDNSKKDACPLSTVRKHSVHMNELLTWLQSGLGRSQHGGQVSRFAVLVINTAARSSPAAHKMHPATRRPIRSAPSKAAAAAVPRKPAQQYQLI